MQCPLDSNKLEKSVYEAQIETDQCPACSGMWLDYGELEAIQESMENDYTEELQKIPNYVDRSYKFALAGSEKICPCPRCKRDMEKREYGYCSQIQIDVCPSCRGIWLDRDEIQELEVFFEKCRFEANEIRPGLFRSFLSFFS